MNNRLTPTVLLETNSTPPMPNVISPQSVKQNCECCGNKDICKYRDDFEVLIKRVANWNDEGKDIFSVEEKCNKYVTKYTGIR